MLNTPGRQPRVPVDVIQFEPGPRRLFRRLVHHRIARDQRGRRHAGRERQRKVEWGDTGKHAIGTEHIGVALHRGDPAHWPDEAVGVFHLLTVVVDQIGRLFGVAHGLEPALPHLETHQRRELILPFPDEGRRPAQKGHSIAPGPAAPFPLSPPCRLHRGVYVLRPRGAEPAQHQAGVDRRAVHQRLGGGLDRCIIYVERVQPPGLTTDGLERGVEPLVELLQVTAGRGVGDLGCGRHDALLRSEAVRSRARLSPSTSSSI